MVSSPYLKKMTGVALETAGSPIRRAGKRARDQLLEAAGEVFAEKGFDRATSREICVRADMNAAAVNYHFGGIDALYAATLVLASRRIATIDEVRAIAASDLTPQEKLRTFLRPIMRWLTVPRSWEMKLLSREAVSPSPMKEVFMQTETLPKINVGRQIIADVIGAKPDDPIVGRTFLTVVAPCLLMAVADRSMLDTMLQAPTSSEAESEALIKHYLSFIEAGIAEISRAHKAGKS